MTGNGIRIESVSTESLSSIIAMVRNSPSLTLIPEEQRARFTAVEILDFLGIGYPPDARLPASPQPITFNSATMCGFNVGIRDGKFCPCLLPKGHGINQLHACKHNIEQAHLDNVPDSTAAVEDLPLGKRLPDSAVMTEDTKPQRYSGSSKVDATWHPGDGPEDPMMGDGVKWDPGIDPEPPLSPEDNEDNEYVVGPGGDPAAPIHPLIQNLIDWFKDSTPPMPVNPMRGDYVYPGEAGVNMNKPIEELARAVLEERVFIHRTHRDPVTEQWSIGIAPPGL